MAISTPKIGSRIADRYRVVSLLGRGGMGTVFAVEDSRMPGHSFALKILRDSDPKWLHTFRQEFSLLASSSHPNLVRVHDYGVDSARDTPFYTSDLIEGEPLDLSKGGLSEDILIEVAVQVSRALYFLHQRGVLHGDVKPANILRSAKSRTFVLVDLGLARPVSESDSEVIAGTPLYMAPEIWRGDPVDARSDLFSLGIALQALSAKDPETSAAWNELVVKLCEQNPNARFQSAAQVISAINRTLGKKFAIFTSDAVRGLVQSPKLVGRDDLLDTLLRHASHSDSETSIALHGSFGMGKSRLLREIRTSLQLKGAHVTNFSFSDEKKNEVARLLTDLTNDILAANPTLKKSPTPTRDAGNLTADLVRFLSGLPAGPPHTLLIDDIDLASPNDRKVLGSLFSSTCSRLRIIFSSENAFEIGTLSPLRNIALSAFMESDLAAYLESLQIEVDPRVAAAILKKSKGVPGLVESIVRQSLLDKWPLADATTADHIRKIELPSDGPDFYRRRLSDLSDDERNLLELLAVSDRSLPIRLLPHKPALQLFESGLISTESTIGEPLVRLSNPILAQKLIRELSPAQRKATHESVARAFVEWNSDHGAIAEHWLRSAQPQNALPHLLAAVENLHALHGNREAVHLLDLAAPLFQESSAPEKIVRLRSLAADIYARVGKFEEAQEQLEGLLKKKSNDLPIILRRLADVALKRRDLKNALSLCDRSERELKRLAEKDRRAEEVRLLSIRQVAALLRADSKEVDRLGDEIEAAGRLAPARERILSLNLRGHAAHNRKEMETARRHYETALAEARSAGFPSFVAMALGSLARLIDAEEMEDKSDPLFRQAIEASEEASDTLATGTIWFNYAAMLETKGEYGKALEAYQRAITKYEEIENHRERAATLFRSAMLRFFLWKERRSEDFKLSLSLLEGSDNPNHAAYAQLGLAHSSEKPSARKENFLVAGKAFERLRDPFGRNEVALALLDLDPELGTDIPHFRSLRLKQQIFLLEILDRSETQRSKITDDLLKEAETAARKHANPEWLARLFALQSRMEERDGESGEATRHAAEAVKIFYQLAARLDERHQQPYLNLRKIDDLKRRAKESAAMSDDSSSISLRMVRDASPQTIAHLLDLLRTLNAEPDLPSISAKLVDSALELTRAERGFLVLTEGKDFRVVAARNIDQKWIREPSQRFSRSVVNEVLELGRSVDHGSINTSRKWKGKKSLIATRTRSFVCAPVTAASGLRGALYLDRTENAEPFRPTDITVAEVLGEQAASILERTRLIDELRQREVRIEHLNLELETALGRTRLELNAAKDLIEYKDKEARLKGKSASLVTRSPKMKRVLETVDRASGSPTPVYIFGESGTGKEIVARSLHEKSPQASAPFVAVNCSTIPPNLFESAFFGHVASSFTGASSNHTGFFVMANEGTLFLDEIGDLPTDIQPKFLRALQENRVRPIGGHEEIPFVTRIISASNRDLSDLVSTGEFREDLFYRLHVLRIDLPPLRDRLEDLPHLVDLFVRDAAKDEKIPIPSVGDDVLALLMKYPWPGNVRQLKNEIDRVIAVLPRNEKRLKLTPEMFSRLVHAPVADRGNLTGTLPEIYDRIAYQMVTAALEEHEGNKSRVAQAIGLTRPGLRKMMKRLKIRET